MSEIEQAPLRMIANLERQNALLHEEVDRLKLENLRLRLAVPPKSDAGDQQ